MNSDYFNINRKFCHNIFQIYVLLITFSVFLYAYWNYGYLITIRRSNNDNHKNLSLNQDYNKFNPQTSLNESGEYIYWYARGRLGNLMFQYAAIYALAKDTAKIPALIVRKDKLKNKRLSNFFQVSHIDLPDPVQDIDSGHNLKIYNVSLSYDNSLPSRVNYEGYNAFHGFPNSYKYFIHHQSDIAQEFRFKPKIQTSATLFLKNVARSRFEPVEHVAYVGIHVRRTDMIEWTTKQRAKFSGLSYLNKAMTWYRNYFAKSEAFPKSIKYIFIMCSDDLPWCKVMFDTSSDVTFCRGRSAIEDLAILASCNYSIITQGTYGWWAAFLARGRVTVYPTNYYQNDAPHLVEKNFTYDTKYPLNWIGLSF